MQIVRQIELTYQHASLLGKAYFHALGWAVKVKLALNGLATGCLSADWFELATKSEYSPSTRW
ncbi:hypothetical protein GCM10026988_37640 [Vibrio panuliri]|uniref:Uncharacterized protein n=1 Tax=Vibrio panuliri TaxID=1381081 RepID=A0ABX3FRR8_9VIBR|nr:hypothetical protein BIY20_21050 [Vibrio panuliri]